MFLDPGAVNFPGAFGANFIGNNTVVLGVYHGTQLFPEAGKRVRLQPAFKDGILNAEAPVFAHLGDFVQALGIGDVVGNEREHLVGAAAVAGEVTGGGTVGGKPIGGRKAEVGWNAVGARTGPRSRIP